nr:MAG TPA: hypothetical protein [Caudoviricetes sp.]
MTGRTTRIYSRSMEMLRVLFCLKKRDMYSNDSASA